MATEISTKVRDVVNDATAALFAGGVLEIRTGAPPGVNAADAGTLLLSITLPNPAFAASAGGAAAKQGTWEAQGVAAGVAGHFRFKQVGDPGTADSSQERLEGVVTDTAGNGDLKLDNVNIAVGQTVTINTYSLTTPAS